MKLGEMLIRLTAVSSLDPEAVEVRIPVAPID